MMKKIYAIIAITLILLIINICLSLYISSDEYYEDNYLSHYYKLKNMPTIIPFDFEEPEYVYEYEDDDLIYQHLDTNGNYALIFNNKYNVSHKSLNYCYSLLNEFIFCLSPGNDKNHKCIKLFAEKMGELDRCETINFNFNFSIQNMKDNIVYFNLPNNEMNTDIEIKFEKEKKFNDIKDFSLDDDNENNINNLSIEEEKPKNNQIDLYHEKKEENINYSKLDCVEYGLIDEHIICTKYE
jgi:hypothetical protein